MIDNLVSRREWLTGALLMAMPNISTSTAASNGILTPEQFGAVGDGVSNDTLAFQKLAAVVNAAGGGTVEFMAGKTYILGVQTFDANVPVWGPAPLGAFNGCTKPLVIRGNGATLKFANNLRYGRHYADGTVAGENLGVRAIPADYFEGLLTIKNCTAPVRVSDINFDGNVVNMSIGGPDHAPGDSGWQIPGDGLLAFDNRGGELYENLNFKNCPRDGAMVGRGADGTNGIRVSRTSFVNCVADGSGRLGFSVIGGRGYSFCKCRGINSGTGPVSSAPASGMDVEAELSPIRDVTLTECEFYGNTNTAFVADSGDTENLFFIRSTFVGTKNWGAWLSKGPFYAEDCTFLGPTNVPYQSHIPAKAGAFVRCKFSDDPRLSRTGVLARGNPLLNGAGGSLGLNNLYDRCVIEGGHQGYGPALSGSIFQNCSITVLPPYKLSIFNGTFRGKNIISAPLAAISDFPNFVVQSGGELVFNRESITH